VGKSFIIKIIILSLVLAVVASVVISSTAGKPADEERTASKTFFSQFVVAGGPIVWFVLLPMSIVTLSVAAEHVFSIRRKKLAPPETAAELASLIRRFGPGQLQARLSGRDDLVSTAVEKAIGSFSTERRITHFRTLVAESLQEQTLRLLRKIEWANIIGNVAPMVGLFGTVFGMIKAFNSIVIAGGQPQPAQLAEGISIALVTTFWGLLIAIPALSIYGIFRNRIETLASEAAMQAEMVVSEIIRTGRSVRDEKNQKQADDKLPTEAFS